MRIKLLLLFGAAALLLGPTTGLTQFPQRDSSRGQPGGGRDSGGTPGGGGFRGTPGGGLPSGVPPGGGGFRGGGFGGMPSGGFGGGSSSGGRDSRGGSSGGFGDPAEIFNRMTDGKDVWVRSEITDERRRGFFDMMATRLGITDGRITRQQYLDAQQQGRGGFSGSGSGRDSGRGDTDAWAESSFRRADENGDGVLNYDEMPESLRFEKDKWDTNNNNFIDRDEFKSFYRARAEQMRSERGESGRGGFDDVPPPPVEDEPKHVVYKAGNLPRELPSWFRENDKDQDAQVGLYEWKHSGRSLDDFLAMDGNGDGFVTVEEALRAGKGGSRPGENGSFAGRGFGPGGFGGDRGSFGSRGNDSGRSGGDRGSYGGRGDSYRGGDSNRSGSDRGGSDRSSRRPPGR